jgi:hypothetical protein
MVTLILKAVPTTCLTKAATMTLRHLECLLKLMVVSFLTRCFMVSHLVTLSEINNT